MTIAKDARIYVGGLFRPEEGRENLFLSRLAYFCWNTLKRCRLAIARAGFNSRTIAEYFRRQGAQIGIDCDIAITQLAPEPYLVKLGNHVFVSKGVQFHTHDGGVWVLREKSPGIRCHGTIVVEDNCIIGVNAVILPNVRIGHGSIVGAGSVVISDVPPNSIVMGVPARAIGSVTKYEQQRLTKWNEQRPPDLIVGRETEWWKDKRNRLKVRKHLLELFAEDLK